MEQSVRTCAPISVACERSSLRYWSCIIGAIPTVLENMAPILAVARAMTTAVNEFVTMALGS